MTFHDPLLLLLAVVAFPVVWRTAVRPRLATVAVAGTEEFSHLKAPLHLRAAPWAVTALRVAAILAVVAAIARPQEGRRPVRAWAEGVDVVLAIDVSGSMAAEDLAAGFSRLDVVKEVVEGFIRKRTEDRIGMVVFAKYPYTQCPLTLDTETLIAFLAQVRIGMIDRTNTAIGDALGVSLALLTPKASGAKSRAIVLLTDGTNNSGALSPAKAASMAAQLGVKVYAIGAGSRGVAGVAQAGVLPDQAAPPTPGDIDEATLNEIAEQTGGKYFRATDRASLRGICETIDRLEKTVLSSPTFYEYDEKFGVFVLIALAAFLCEAALANTLFRKIP